MRNDGGWLSPDGRLLWSTQSHVVDMIGYPQAFGLTRADIDAVYREYGEPVGQEGKAREKLIRDAVAAHWIRFRRDERGEPPWSVAVQALNGAARRRITDRCSPDNPRNSAGERAPVTDGLLELVGIPDDRRPRNHYPRIAF